MSTLPSPAPENNPTPAPTPAPKLTLTPKPPAPAPVALPVQVSADAPTVFAPAAAAAPGPTADAPAPKPTLVPKQSLKLQSNPDAESKLPNNGAFVSPMPNLKDSDGEVSPVFTVLSGLAAAAALTFAYLLFLKNK